MGREGTFAESLFRCVHTDNKLPTGAFLSVFCILHIRKLMFRERNDLLISNNSEVMEPGSDQDLICPKLHTETWIRITSNLWSLMM